ncbi:MAG TPA: ABC transporter substrate-binding protein [Stellaceae bacterium]|jgi:putative ABC transport system substrate-binding protein|nr:ABC transporter substrate-binding protein [Stellaceae bacterium]
MIGRREFVEFIGVAAAWPCVLASASEKVRRVGVLANEAWPPLDGLRQGLDQLGYVEGRNLQLEYRFAEGQTGKFPVLAAELVQLPVEVIVTVGTPASLAAMRATKAIPIIAQSGDPIASGLAASLAHPGGNLTGMSSQATDVEGKRLQLLKELLPGLSRVGVLANPANPYTKFALENARRGAEILGLKLEVVELSTADAVDGALQALSLPRPDAVLVIADPFLLGERTRIAEFTARNRLPSMFTFHEHVVAGGLMSYATNYRDLFQRMAVVVDKVLKGASPGDLPIEQPTQFELTLNLRTARELGIEIPSSLLARADDVIE